MDNYQKYIHLSRYARYRDDLGRRETWEETVARYFDFFEDHVTSNYPPKARKLFKEHRAELEQAVLDLEVMPSMRALMTAGPALARDNVAGYNCSYVPIERVRDFDELMYNLMCGTGVGFSVERQYVSNLPQLPEEFHATGTTIVVSDSKIGWASSFRELLSLLFAGKVPEWDLTRIRPAGSRLKTFGGRASGPEPLASLFDFTVSLCRKAAGRKLTSLECHDLVCKIADVVVVGGVRRSALISLSNLSDDRMRDAKSGAWWEEHPQRALANNSACYTETPDMGVFMKEWSSLYASKTGERGIFSRPASQAQAEKTGRRDSSYAFGTNPCSEIILRPRQFCNLSEVVVRPCDDLGTLKRKVRLATILGTLQATLTNFRYLSREWKNNCDEERLLGVSLTGICDNPHLAIGDETTITWLKEMKDEAITVNKSWALALGINPSTSITCVKPSGTVSQLCDSASGIHPRHAERYVRTVRADKQDPLAKWMVEQGFPVEDDVTKPGHTYVFSFPMEAPTGALVREAQSALQQLRLWQVYQEHWCEHKPSITVSVREQEWMDVGAWVYKNFSSLSGVSFLPFSEHTYKQAPYQVVTEKEFVSLQRAMPTAVDFSSFKEVTDATSASQELACTAGTCEL